MRREITPERAWELYDRGRRFKEAVDLYETVNTNENFFIGKQWEGVRSNGLPTPVFNILKRDVCFLVSLVTSDNLTVQASALAASADTRKLREPVRVLNEELERLFEHNRVTALLREFARDAAVRGDGCMYAYWDADEGTVRTEILKNTMVHFGNPNERRVQKQPYILIESRESVEELRRRAKSFGCETFEDIVPDGDGTGTENVHVTDDKATKLFLMWRDRETGLIWGYECARGCTVRPAFCLGLRRYPLVWMSWDNVQDSYHGQAMLTGLIPNQIFINKMWAMSMLSLMTTAYPKIIYDRTRIPKWTNQVGQAIGIAGGDVSSAARALTPAAVSPQVTTFIDAAISQTNANLGATNVALGDARPDNTSAIIALQRAAATPSEITKQALRESVEELARVYLEFIGAFYGVRTVDVETPARVREAMEFAGLTPPEEVPGEFDFGVFRDMPMALKIDVGASAYFSEIASIQTLDNLLTQGKIDILQYLERIPDGYVSDRRGLIAEIKGEREKEED